jgi:hypothetical protein
MPLSAPAGRAASMLSCTMEARSTGVAQLDTAAADAAHVEQIVNSGGHVNTKQREEAAGRRRRRRHTVMSSRPTRWLHPGSLECRGFGESPWMVRRGWCPSNGDGTRLLGTINRKGWAGRKRVAALHARSYRSCLPAPTTRTRKADRPSLVRGARADAMVRVNRRFLSLHSLSFPVSLMRFRPRPAPRHQPPSNARPCARR